jgi:hypothetical protein
MTWAPSYCSSADLTDYIRVEDAVDDVQVALACEAASRAIDLACHRQFGLVASAEARYYTARYDSRRYRWVVPIDDLMTTTNMTVAYDSACDGTYATTITAYDPDPRNAAAKGRPWTELAIRSTSTSLPNDEPDGVKVTARWGWSAVPDTIKMAALLQSSRVLARRDSPLGVTGSPEMGSAMRLLAKLDPDVEAMLRPYRRWWAAAETGRSYAQVFPPALFGWSA